MISNGGILGASAAGPSFIDAGIYADDSDGSGRYAVAYYLNKRAIFVYVRELSGLNSKQLSVCMSNIRKYW